MVSISNDRLKVGVDMQRGGAISWLSSPQMPGALANANLVNTWDSGRLIQQSYYGCYDDTCWVDKPWRWNPVQGGSWQNGPPRLVANNLGGDSVAVTSVPRNWGGQQLMDDVLMVTETKLLPDVIKVSLDQASCSLPCQFPACTVFCLTVCPCYYVLACACGMSFNKPVR